MANNSDFKLLLDSIPNYDGNPKTLSQFIMNVEEIHSLINSMAPAANQLQKSIAFLTVKNKIIGKANEELRNIKFETWEQLKAHLINNFADHQSPESVVIEIMKMNPNNKNIFKALSEVKEKFDLFRAKINLADVRQESKEDIVKFQESIITNNFVSSLKDPLRNNLATRGPKTLSHIEQLLLNDFQYLNAQNLDPPKHRLLNIPPTKFPASKFPTGPIKFQNQNYQHQHYQQKPFAQRQRVQNAQNMRPTPMSVTTKQSFRQTSPQTQNNYFRQQNQNPSNYVAEELFANDTGEYLENDEYDHNEYYQQNENQCETEENDSFLDLGNINIDEKS